MSYPVACSSCGFAFHMLYDPAGRTLMCPKCLNPIVAGGIAGTPPSQLDLPNNTLSQVPGFVSLRRKLVKWGAIAAFILAFGATAALVVGGIVKLSADAEELEVAADSQTEDDDSSHLSDKRGLDHVSPHREPARVPPPAPDTHDEEEQGKKKSAAEGARKAEEGAGVAQKPHRESEAGGTKGMSKPVEEGAGVAQKPPAPDTLDEEERRKKKSAAEGAGKAEEGAGVVQKSPREPERGGTKGGSKPAEVGAGVVQMPPREPGVGGTKDTSKPTEKLIDYGELEKWSALNGKFGMILLVDESASKAEVLKLAESLKRRYAGGYVQIVIFNSRDTYLRWKKLDEVAKMSFRNNREEHEGTREPYQLSRSIDVNEAEKKHWLVTIWSGGEIEWTVPDWKSLEEKARQRQVEQARTDVVEEEKVVRGAGGKKAPVETRVSAVRQKAEQRATANLEYARRLYFNDDVGRARERLNWIMREMPATKAADEANVLLELWRR